MNVCVYLGVGVGGGVFGGKRALKSVPLGGRRPSFCFLPPNSVRGSDSRAGAHQECPYVPGW